MDQPTRSSHLREMPARTQKQAMITDERLASLIQQAESTHVVCSDAVSEGNKAYWFDTANALRELQQLRAEKRRQDELHDRFRGRPIDPERAASDFRAPSED